MTILPLGNVGIGTAFPATKLDIAGDATFLGRQFFGHGIRQILNLFGEGFGIGVQTANLYFRTGAGFAWHIGGVHADGTYDPGGGATLMTLDINRGLDFGSRLGQLLSLWGSSGNRQFGMGIQAERSTSVAAPAPAMGSPGTRAAFTATATAIPVGRGIALMTIDEENGLVVSNKTTHEGPHYHRRCRHR